MKEIRAVYASEDGNIFDAPLAGMGRLGEKDIVLQPQDLIPLPASADLMFLPERQAVGFSVADGQAEAICGQAVSAILPAGYTRLYMPSFHKEEGAAQLPLYGYTAVVLYDEELYVAALYTDENEKWDPVHYNTHELKKLVKAVQRDLPHNPIVEQVAGCSLQWHCCTAQNLFYRRWEAGIPVSPRCNAACLGCISLQPAECCPSPQERINFLPTAKEIAEVGIYHLSFAPEGIISFGQGCEGEPSLAADNIAEAIKKIRQSTEKGQININTNAGYTAGIKKIVDAGLDTMRVSIISAREESYAAYYRSNYQLDSVKESLHYALEHGIYVSLNLLYFPGFNDRAEELAAWMDFLAAYSVQMIQIRNLNIDPESFLSAMPERSGNMLGTKYFLNALQEAFPKMQIGSFSHFIAQNNK